MAEENKIKVLFWPGVWYPDRLNPLNGIFIRRHAEAVAPLVDLAVLYVAADAGLKKRVYEVEDAVDGEGGLTVRVYFRPFPVPFPLMRLLNVWRYFRAARRGIHRLRSHWGTPRVLHLHVNPPWGQIAALKLGFPGLPFLFTEHWTGYHPANGEFRGFFRRRLTAWVTRHAFAVTPVSRNLQGVMEGHGLRGRYVIVANAVRTDLFRPGERVQARRPFTFLHVSRLAPVKNVAGILRAAAALQKTRPDFRLLIAGQGPERPGLESLAARLFGDNGRVRFVGRKDERELAEIMRDGDGLVLFSDYENLPCVVAEAMACGLPVIATRVGGVPEQVFPGSGLLIEPRDEEGLQRAMAEMIDHAGRFDRAAIREFAEREYSLAAVGRRFLQLYRDALAGRRGPS
jgi:glycosyltransferase involved in cell wall biosynthesis